MFRIARSVWIGGERGGRGRARLICKMQIRGARRPIAAIEVLTNKLAGR